MRYHNGVKDFDSTQLPPDPFEDEPLDIELGLEPADIAVFPADDEREGLQRDLTLVHQFRAVLSPLGCKGILAYCEQHDEISYHDWHSIVTELTVILESGRLIPREPAISPDTAAYVTWDYALGYLDAVHGRSPKAHDENL